MTNENMILIMVDECGDEVEVARYSINTDGEFAMDEDELEIWQDRKIRKAAEEYPEARYFYFEDRRHWNSLIHRMMLEDEGCHWDEDEDEDWEPDISSEDLAEWQAASAGMDYWMGLH